MVGDIGVHGTDDAKVIGAFAHFLEDVRNLQPALAVFFETKGGLHGHAGGAFGFQFERNFFTVVFGELWFGVEGVDLGRSAVHEEMNDGFGLASVLRFLGRKGADGSGGHGGKGKARHPHAGAL